MKAQGTKVRGKPKTICHRHSRCETHLLCYQDTASWMRNWPLYLFKQCHGRQYGRISLEEDPWAVPYWYCSYFLQHFNPTTKKYARNILILCSNYTNKRDEVHELHWVVDDHKYSHAENHQVHIYKRKGRNTWEQTLTLLTSHVTCLTETNSLIAISQLQG